MMVVLIAELPCMIRTAALQLQSGKIWDVVWGTIAGSTVALILGLGIAKMLGSQVADSQWINWISGLLIIGIGIYMIAFGE